jgi:hypothetical protein
LQVFTLAGFACVAPGASGTMASSSDVFGALKSFFVSGSAAVFAELVTIPLDTAKVRLLFRLLACDSACPP